jgi:hypothetical protein
MYSNIVERAEDFFGLWSGNKLYYTTGDVA